LSDEAEAILHLIQPKKRFLLSALLVFVWLAWSAEVASAQSSIQTIITNGPASNRLNIVVLSEGYTTNQLPQFLVDATNAVATLLSHSPYQEYSNYCNAFAIKVASNQTGSDHPSYSQVRDTYFNSTFDSIDKLITIPTNSAGQGKVDTLIQTFMPKCSLAILLVNDLVSGGSDGFDKTAIASVGAVSVEDSVHQPSILSHETGHVLANLGDEYTNAYSGFPNTEEPNTTMETRRDFIKWNAWISTNTPVPTTVDYIDVIGLFQGAHYHPTNWYRPKLNCAMGNIGTPFCEVCSEALTLAFYQRVRPVDSFVPGNTNLSITTTQGLAFSVAVLQPVTHNLSVQWLTNGTALAGATNATFNLLPQSLGNGSNWVRAMVKDTTPLVRKDPTNLLTQTVTWGVTVSIPQLQLDSPAWLAGGKFRFHVTGNAPQNFAIQSTTNFSTWTPLSTNSLANGQFWYTNASASNSVRRFFRAVTPP
jgi:IgA Peptidase M64